MMSYQKLIFFDLPDVQTPVSAFSWYRKPSYPCP